MYKRIRNYLRDISISKRLSYSFFALSLLPICIVGLIGTKIASEAILNKSTKYIVQLVETIEDNLEQALENYETLLNELMVNGVVQRGFKTYSEKTYAEKAQLKNALDQVVVPKLSSYPYIRDIKMINMQNEIIYQRGYLLNDNTHIEKMLQALEEIGGATQCFKIDIYGQSYIVMSRYVYEMSGKEAMGVIMMVLKEEALGEIYSHIHLGEGSNIYLVDQRGEVISAQYAYLSERFEVLMNDVKRIDETYFAAGSGTNREMVVHEGVGQYSIELITTVPYKYLFKEVHMMSKQIVIVMIICFITSVILSKTICRSILQPLKKLMAYITLSMQEKFSTEYADESRDELGVLSRNFNEITREMQQMIQQIEQDEKERTALEISMLQAQINPHFLFNTLNSLRWISMMSGADSVSEGILALSDLLKNTIIQKAEYISIKSELDNIRNYMLIQKLRYGDSFELKIHVDQQYLEHKTLKFILQPIVENAIIHGAKEDGSQLHIDIALEEQAETLVIYVCDDGKGFDLSRVEDKENKDVKLSGIGVNNVKDRIRLHFGEAYGLEIETEINQGTCVKLTVPKIGGE